MTENQTAKPVQGRDIYWIGGSKGGVGKSMQTIALLDYLVTKAEPVLLVECDTSNADVWKAYHEQIPAEGIDLDVSDGWVELINTCQSHPDKIIVINTAARNNEAVSKFGGTLDSALEELGRRLVTLWLINRQRDSLELLRSFQEAIPQAMVHVVRNGYFGEERKFELYNTSQFRQHIESKGGKSLTLPDLGDRVADDVYTRRLSVSEAARTLPLGNRAELNRWRAEVKKMLSEIFG